MENKFCSFNYVIIKGRGDLFAVLKKVIARKSVYKVQLLYRLRGEVKVSRVAVFFWTAGEYLNKKFWPRISRLFPNNIRRVQYAFCCSRTFGSAGTVAFVLLNSSVLKFATVNIANLPESQSMRLRRTTEEDVAEQVVLIGHINKL